MSPEKERSAFKSTISHMWKILARRTSQKSPKWELKAASRSLYMVRHLRHWPCKAPKLMLWTPSFMVFQNCKRNLKKKWSYLKYEWSMPSLYLLESGTSFTRLAEKTAVQISRSIQNVPSCHHSWYLLDNYLEFFIFFLAVCIFIV